MFQKKIKVKIEFEDNLPKLMIDPTLMNIVFSNIISNAIDAMKNNGTLTIVTKKNNNHVVISFKDTGIGISKENMSKIFEPLFSTKVHGIGLGLMSCKNIMDVHKGKIEVDSKVGKGSEFKVSLLVK